MGWMGDRFFGWIWILKNQRLGAGFEVQFFWISGIWVVWGDLGCLGGFGFWVGVIGCGLAMRILILWPIVFELV